MTSFVPGTRIEYVADPTTAAMHDNQISDACHNGLRLKMIVIVIARHPRQFPPSPFSVFRFPQSDSIMTLLPFSTA